MGTFGVTNSTTRNHCIGGKLISNSTHSTAACNSMRRAWNPSVLATNTSAEPTSIIPRYAHTATPIDEYRTIIIGGGITDTQSTNAQEIVEFRTDLIAWNHKTATGDAPPGGLVGHTAVAVGNSIFCIGGWCGDDVYNDQTFVLECGKDSTYKWVKCKTEGTSIGNITGHTAVVWNSVIWVYGGFRIDAQSFKKTLSDELWTLDAKTLEWNHYEGFEGPQKVTGHVSALIEYELHACMAIFGGLTPAGASNSLHVLDFQSLQWTEVKTSGAVPSPRFACSAHLVADNVWAVCGGTDGTNWFSDLYFLNTVTMQWVEVSITPFYTPIPSLAGHVTFATNDALFIQGGLLETVKGAVADNVTKSDWKYHDSVTPALNSALNISNSLFIVEITNRPVMETLPYNQIITYSAANPDTIFNKIDQHNSSPTCLKSLCHAEIKWLKRFLDRACSNGQIAAPTTSVEISREGTLFDTILRKMLQWESSMLLPVLDFARIGILDDAITKHYSEPKTGVKRCTELALELLRRAFYGASAQTPHNKLVAVRFLVNLFKCKHLVSALFVIYQEISAFIPILMKSSDDKERIAVADLMLNYAVVLQWSKNHPSKQSLFSMLHEFFVLEATHKNLEVARRIATAIGCILWRRDERIIDILKTNPYWLQELEHLVKPYADTKLLAILADLHKLNPFNKL